MSGYIDDARDKLNDWANSIDAETFSKQYEALNHRENIINSLDNSSPKLTTLTLSLSVKAVRVPIKLYEDMLLTDNPIISVLDGELYFDKYLVIADESLDCVDFDFEYGVFTENGKVTSDDEVFADDEKDITDD